MPTRRNAAPRTQPIRSARRQGHPGRRRWRCGRSIDDGCYRAGDDDEVGESTTGGYAARVDTRAKPECGLIDRLPSSGFRVAATPASTRSRGDATTAGATPAGGAYRDGEQDDAPAGIKGAAGGEPADKQRRTGRRFGGGEGGEQPQQDGGRIARCHSSTVSRVSSRPDRRPAALG